MFYFKIIIEFFIITTPFYVLYHKEFTFLPIKIIEFTTNCKIYFLIFLIILIVIRYFIDFKKYQRLSKYNKLYEFNEQYISLFQPYIRKLLKNISDELSFDENHRITIYIYSSSQKKFYYFGRYSKSSTYNEKGREIINDKDEYIFKVLNYVEHYKDTPNMTKFRNRGRKMKSGDMYGVPIWDEKNELKIGVVNFQSMIEKDFSKSTHTINNLVQILNKEINKMNIDPNVIQSNNKPLEGF